MPKRMRVWVWSKQMNSCLWSFEDARNVWPRSRRPRHVWRPAKPTLIGSGGATADDQQRRGGGAGRPFKHPFGVPDDKAQDNFTDPQSRIMKMGGSFEPC